MRKIINLPFIKILEENLKSHSGLIQVLLGPRQVGKTTTILHFLEKKLEGKYHYASADQVFNSDANWIIEQWNIALKNKKLLVIDEIQKCQNWAEVIKQLWDSLKRQKKTLQCVLLGSSSLKIQKGLTESLTGRFQLIPAFHWNFAETVKGYKLNFEDFLKYGGYPGAYKFISSEDKWHDYIKNSIINTIIEKDILQYHTVKSPALFRQAFDILMSYPAQEISFTKLLGQIQDKGNVELVKNYLHMYEGAFLLKAIYKYSKKPVLTKSSSPKIIPMAPSLFFLTIRSEYRPDERGHIFEAVVGTQLVRTGHDLFYWRKNNNEVDYILRQGKKTWAIEVKSGRKKNPSSLMKFKEENPDALLIIITPDNYKEFEEDPMVFLNSYS